MKLYAGQQTCVLSHIVGKPVGHQNDGLNLALVTMNAYTVPAVRQGKYLGKIKLIQQSPTCYLTNLDC